jgi:damage control phosphatase ARMT1-like protein
LTEYVIPAPQIDPRTLPPQIRTSELGSFAHNTLAVRLPRIVQDTIELNAFPPQILNALQGLRAELIGGLIRGVAEDASDRHFWNDISREYIGRSWLDVPWYWAEAFFYRRILEATRYFQPGPMHHVDPYRAAKLTELVPEVAPRAAAITLRGLPADLSKRFEILLFSSLWGNRIDLSYKVAMEAGPARRLEDERKNLLVDDSEHLWDALHLKPSSHLALIADNAGTELTMDLLLVDFLLENDLAAKISLHLKQQPFFVSDAMPEDMEAELGALARGEPEAQALAGRVRAHREQGRLDLYPHWFYTTSLFYFQLPDDLRRELSKMDLVILKGDANYRRLLGDAHWDPITSFDQATAYFPAPLVALRTLKAELIVGLSPGEPKRLSQIDPDWMVNGRRGMVQARL